MSAGVGYSGGRSKLVGRGVTYPVPIPLDPAPHAGAVVHGANGLLYASDGTAWRSLVDEALAATIAADVAGNIARFIEPETELTVGTGGDYPTINAALAYLLGFLNNTQGFLAPARITILSGYTVEEQMLYQGVDLSWIQISAEDAWVPTDTAALSITDLYAADVRPLFGIYNGAAPIIDCGFEFFDNAFAGVAGIAARASRILSLPYSVDRPDIGFKGTLANGYILRSACSGRIDNPTVENHTAVAVEVRGNSSLVLTGGSYRSTTVGARSIVSAGFLTIGPKPGDTSVDLRRVSGVNNDTDIQVVNGGMISVGQVTLLGGTSQPVNVQTQKGLITHSSAAFKAFGTTNAVGAVSQSGGNPTGALIERGSNTNGAYTKWADGTMHVTKSLTGLGPVSSTSGSNFSSGAISIGTLAATFSAAPKRFLGANGALVWPAGTNTDPSVSDGGNFVLLRSVSSADTTFRADALFVGNWF